MKREPLQTEEYFKKTIAYYEGEEKKWTDDIAAKTPSIKNWSNVYSFLFEAQLHIAFNKYSLGEPVSEMKSYLIKAAKNFIIYLNYPDTEKVTLKVFFGIYDRILWFVSFGVLFNFDNNLFSELKETIDKKRGRDKLIDLIASFKLKNNKITDKIAYPKIFNELITVWEKPANERAAVIENYLKDWKKKMRSSSWVGTDKLKEGTAFFGYWSFEAAAITFILDIDDSSYKDAPYYPKDLIAFARNKK